MQGIEAHSRHPDLLTPSSARLRPALVVTSCFIEHRRTEHPFLIYRLSPILEFSDVQNSTICLVIFLWVRAGATDCAAGAPGQAPSPVLVSVGRMPSSGASVVGSLVVLLTEFLSPLFMYFFVRSHTPCFGPYTSGLLIPVYLLMTRSPILSHLGSPGSTSSGLGLGLSLFFCRLRPILFSLFPTRASMDVGEASDTPPVVPLELLPPVNTGSPNNTLALSSAVKVQVAFLVNSKRSISASNSFKIGSLLSVEPSSPKMGYYPQSCHRTCECS